MSMYLGSKKINFIDEIVFDNDIVFEEYMSNSLTNVELNDLDGIKNIRPYAFYKMSNLSSIIFPKTLKKIGEGAFKECYKLKEITCHAMIPPIYNDFYDFYFGNNIDIIYIPVGTIDLYSNANGWSIYSDKLVEKDGV